MGARDRPPGEHSPWAVPSEGDEPEPEWAEQIRAARRDRGAKLRHVYSRFADEPTPLDDEPAPAKGEATPRDDDPAIPGNGDDRR